MAKLSEAMIKGLRAIADVPGTRVHPRTMDALYARSLITDGANGPAVTQDGAHELVKADHAEREAAYQASKAEPECREGNDPPHPIGAPGCVLNGWEGTAGAPMVEAKPTERATFRPAGEITVTTGDSGPSVRLTMPRSSSALPEATDAEVLQLLAVLDAGGSVHRALYQEWGVLDAGPFRLNLDAVNRAARDAVRFALARQTFANHEYTLTAEPVHLDAGNGHSACGFPLAGYTIRHRVTTDPSKVTHERCLTT